MLIYLHELRQNRKSFIVWTIILLLYIIVYMSMFPSLAESNTGIAQMFENLPEGMKKAFDLHILDMSNVLGYFSMEGHLFVILFGGIFATLMSANILTKEESDKTAEFLLAKPVTRSQVVTSKLLAFVTYVILLNIIIGLALFMAIETVTDQSYSRTELFHLILAAMLGHLCLSSLGFLASALLSKSKKVLPLAMAITLGTYGIYLIAKLADKLKDLQYISPFYYANASDIIANGTLAADRAGVLIVVSAIAVALTYVVYNRKDIAL